MPEMRTSKTTRKVKAAAIGGGGAGSMVFYAVMTYIFPEMSEEMILGLLPILTGAITWAVGYLTSPSHQDKVI